MSETQIQYVADPNGNLTSVLIPIELWREIEVELEMAYLSRGCYRESGNCEQRCYFPKVRC